jgi:hypothetical protein
MQLELGGGSTEFEVRRLPARQGTSSDPRLEGRRRCRHVLLHGSVLVLQKDWIVILGSFCKVLPSFNIIMVSSQKKK